MDVDGSVDGSVDGDVDDRHRQISVDMKRSASQRIILILILPMN